MDESSEICDLCGLPLRYGRVSSVVGGKTYRFCCMGCRQVFHMLMEASDDPDPAAFRQTELFSKCVAMGIIPASEEDLQRRTAAFGSTDNPAPAADSAGESAADGFLELTLQVGGMWCPACAWVIEETLQKQPGVANAACSFSTDRVRCRYDPVETSPARVQETIARLGYRATEPGEAAAAAHRRREFVRFGISAFLTMNVMMLSFALYSGFFTELTPEDIRKLSWPVFGMASVVFFYGGWGIHRKAWAGVKAAAAGMETLITAGAASAYFYSTYNFASGSIHLYYDTASMLITLVLLGKMIEGRARDRVSEDLAAFFALQPTKVKLSTAEYPQGRYVSAGMLQRGDAFIVEEGETVAADGRVLAGNAAVDESSLTGEALPVTKREGDPILSGARVLRGAVSVEAREVGDKATLGQMILIMERALGRKTPLEGRTDVILRWFVPGILLLAVMTGAVCLLRGLSLEPSLVRAVTVMVISCPCALGIAIPLARVAGMAMAGRRGILVRDFGAFEQAARVNAVVFDKTGTVTQGQWRLLRIETFDELKPDEALALAAGLEVDANHLIAEQLRREAMSRGLQPPILQERKVCDNGVAGSLEDERFKLGSRSFALGSRFADGAAEDRRETAAEGFDSKIYLSRRGRPQAVFVFGDQTRPGARSAVETLRRRGFELALVSGDGEEPTGAVASYLGIRHVAGGFLPGEKAAFVESWQRRGRRVAMVGDGINDAPAMAQADLALAVHGQGRLNRQMADATLMRSDPGQVLEFIELTGAVNRKIHQNLWCSLVYNVISIPVAMGGLLTPLVAVCAMLLSSLSVTGNTLLLLRRG